tara:strand:- start:620 stop:808 length:189 start_codon:yes stop_codon:yes gene_type:complete
MQMLAGGGLDGMKNIPVRSHCHCIPQVSLMQPSVNGNRHVQLTTFSDGCLGSNNDEGRSEVR